MTVNAPFLPVLPAGDLESWLRNACKLTNDSHKCPLSLVAPVVSPFLCPTVRTDLRQPSCQTPSLMELRAADNKTCRFLGRLQMLIQLYSFF